MCVGYGVQAVPDIPPTHMRTRNRAIVRIAGVFACLSLTAAAQSVDAIFINSSPVLSVPGSFDGGGSFANQVSGLSNFDIGPAFCVDPDQRINAGEVVHYVIQPDTALPNYDAISRIFGGYNASSMTNLDAAGAQWAIWEVVKDGITAPSFSSGLIQIQNAGGSAVATRAMDYLSNLGSLPAIDLVYVTSSTRQDMVFVAVPEAGVAVLGALGGVLLMFRRRR